MWNYSQNIFGYRTGTTKPSFVTHIFAKIRPTINYSLLFSFPLGKMKINKNKINTFFITIYISTPTHLHYMIQKYHIHYCNCTRASFTVAGFHFPMEVMKENFRNHF